MSSCYVIKQHEQSGNIVGREGERLTSTTYIKVQYSPYIIRERQRRGLRSIVINDLAERKAVLLKETSHKVTIHSMMYFSSFSFSFSFSLLFLI